MQAAKVMKIYHIPNNGPNILIIYRFNLMKARGVPIY